MWFINSIKYKDIVNIFFFFFNFVPNIYLSTFVIEVKNMKIDYITLYCVKHITLSQNYQTEILFDTLYRFKLYFIKMYQKKKWRIYFFFILGQ